MENTFNPNLCEEKNNERAKKCVMQRVIRTENVRESAMSQSKRSLCYRHIYAYIYCCYYVYRYIYLQWYTTSNVYKCDSTSSVQKMYTWLLLRCFVFYFIYMVVSFFILFFHCLNVYFCCCCFIHLGCASYPLLQVLAGEQRMWMK